MPINDYKKRTLPLRVFVFRAVLLLASLLLLIFLGSGYTHGSQQPNPEITNILDVLRNWSDGSVGQQSEEVVVSGWVEQPLNRFSVLLVGVDQRPDEKSIGNTDTLLVASVNPVTKDVAVLSIPRDTKVELDGQRVGKVNAVARQGHGLTETVQTVENLIGQPIDGYVLTNFNGFKQIVDLLGGITVTVEKDMYYVSGDAQDGIINLRQGTQRLNGAQALQYVRFRQDKMADIGRTRRQQTALVALGREIFQVRNIGKLPRLIPELYSSVKTDLSVGEMLAMSRYLAKLDVNDVVSQTLPGQAVIEDGINYWQVDQVESRKVVRQLWAGMK